MKRLLALICVLLLLCGCGPAAPVETDPTVPSHDCTDPDTTPDTEPATDPDTQPPTDPPDDGTFTTPLHAAVPIFEGPGYDFVYERSVGRDGVYTIIAVSEDEEGNRWGRLKSGLGWVDLTALTAPLPPVTASFDDGNSTDLEGCHKVIVDDSEYITRLIFRATEPVTDVRFSILDYTGPSYTEYETYCILPALSPGKPLAAAVVFYGDMTAYGISYTDAAGVPRHFAVSISGRNGVLELIEYTP